MLFEFLFLINLFIILLLIIYNVKFKVSFYDKLPGPKSYPIIGNSINFLIFSLQALNKWLVYELPKFGPIVILWLLWKPKIVINEASAAEVILSGKKHIGKSDTYRFMKEVFGDGIIPATGHRWKSYRKSLNPAFYTNNLNSFIPIFNKYTKIFLDCINKDENRTSKIGIDIYPYASRCSLDVIFETAMGTSVNAQLNMNSTHFKTNTRISELISSRFRSFLKFDFIWKLSPHKKEMDKKCKYLFEFGLKILNERKEFLKSKGAHQEQENGRNNLIDLLIREEEKHNEYFTKADVVHNMNNFIAAGFDTIAINTSFTLFLLGAHLDIQEQVVEELIKVFGDSGREPDVNDLNQLKLLERCIKESLRLYPPVPHVEKKLEQNEFIGDYEIPSGCDVSFNIQAIHRDTKYFDNPEKFIPDRFLPKNCIGRNPYAFIPFSAGPRICIGQKFALIEVKVILSTFLRRYKVESGLTVDEINDKIPFEMLLRPIGGIPIKIYERTSHPNLQVSYQQ